MGLGSRAHGHNHHYSYLLKLSVNGCRENTILIQNERPKSWKGQKLDLNLYKSGRLLMTKQRVLPGGEAEFVLRPILCFALVRGGVHAGKVVSPQEMNEVADVMAEFDISQSSRGINVTLSEVGSKFMFTAERCKDC